MAAVFILKRASSRAHPRPVVEGTDSIVVSDIERSTAGAATLWTDANTTGITVGAAGADLTIGSDSLRGTDDGSGVIIGHASAGASTGSAPQVVSMTTAQRDDLVAAAGMLVYNSSALTLQVRQNGSWVNLPGADGDSNQQVQPGIVSLGTLLDYPGNGSATGSEVQYTRVFLFAGTTYDAGQFFQVSGGNPARNVNIGLYDQATPSSTTGTPNNRVAETGTTATASGDDGTFVEIAYSVAYTVSTTGYYWIAFITDSSSLRFAASATYRADYLPVRRESGTGTTLPASAGTLTNPSSAVLWSGAVEQ